MKLSTHEKKNGKHKRKGKGMGEGEGEGWDVVHDVTHRRETAANGGREGKGKGGTSQVQSRWDHLDSRGKPNACKETI